MPDEPVSNDQAASSTEPQTSLLGVTFLSLGLPDILGIQQATSVLLREMLFTLTQAGILTNEQVSTMLTTVETRIAKSAQEIPGSTKDSKEEEELVSEFSARIQESANLALQKTRERLNSSSPDSAT